MKFLTLVMIAGFFAGISACENEAAANNEKNDSVSKSEPGKVTTIEWIDKEDQQLAKVKEGQVVNVSWRFKNSGETPLIISDVTAACGCTASKPPKEPIAPGKEGIIEAQFDSKGQGEKPSKTVTVHANTKEKTHVLTFSMEVTKE